MLPYDNPHMPVFYYVELLLTTSQRWLIQRVVVDYCDDDVRRPSSFDVHALAMPGREW